MMRKFVALNSNGVTAEFEAECEIEAEEICEQRGITLAFPLNRDHPDYPEKQAEWERIKERRRNENGYDASTPAELVQMVSEDIEKVSGVSDLQRGPQP